MEMIRNNRIKIDQYLQYGSVTMKILQLDSLIIIVKT
jgi:hypothetical protein